ncbi:vWA domain-containing protein [Patescibacteria group bacterium]
MESTGSVNTPEKIPSSLSEIFDPATKMLLDVIMMDTAFDCKPYPGYPDPPSPEMGIGWFTVPGQRTVYYNPNHLLERDMSYNFAIFAHEMGHHRPEVVKYDSLASSVCKNFKHLFPKEIDSEKVIDSLINVCADIFLEDLNSKGPHNQIMLEMYRKALARDVLEDDDFDKFYDEDNGEISNFPWEKAVKNESDFSDFVSGILLMPKFGFPPEGVFSPKVYEHLKNSYQNVLIIKNSEGNQINMEHKIFATLSLLKIVAELITEEVNKNKNANQDKSSLENFMKFLEEFLKHLQKNHQAKAKEMCGKGDGEGQGDGDGDGDGQGKGKGKGKGKGNGNGKGNGEGNCNGNGEGNGEGNGQGKGKGKSGDADKKISKTLKEQVDKVCNNLSSSPGKGLSGSSDRIGATNRLDYHRYVDPNKKGVDELRKTLEELLLQNRYTETEIGQRIGYMIEPGKELFAYSDYMSGESDPPYHMETCEKIEPVELEIELILDTSGSMGSYLYEMLGLLSVFIESVQLLHTEISENFEKYGLKESSQYPIQMGLLNFSTTVNEILPLTDKIDKDLAIEKFNEMQYSGGGTCTFEALNHAHDVLKASKGSNKVKIIILITDGQDYGDELERSLTKIAKDDSIYFLAIGVDANKNGWGDSVKECIQANFAKYARHDLEGKYLAKGFTSVKEAVQAAIAFFKKAVETVKSQNH